MGPLEMRFGILGPLEVADGAGRPLVLGGRQARAVLAILLLHANEVVSSDRLVAELWDSAPPPSATKSVQIHVSRLRRTFASAAGGRRDARIVTAAGGYSIRVVAGELDRECFEHWIDEANAAIAAEEWEPAAAALRDALGLWRGEPLSDFAYDSFAQREIARLVELRIGALERRIDVDLALGRHTEVIGDLVRLVDEHPHRERLHWQLMLALYRAGRQAEALQAYRDARSAIVGELGIEPSPALRDLHQAVLTQDPSLMLSTRSRAAPRSGRPSTDAETALLPRTGAVAPTNLPARGPPLVGRERERAELCELLVGDHGQMVTVTGIGGIGKTRLAAAVGRELLDQFAGGVFLVRLAGVSDHASLVPMIAEAVGVTGESGIALTRVLAHRFAAQRTLIILDNFEQLVSASAILAELLGLADGLRVLATSQIPLRVATERTVPLGPLSPADAAGLFVERARAVIPDFSTTGDEHAAIGDICERLDGMPLAIELAAARVGIFSLRELERRLERPLELLTRGRRDAPERQRSLRATIDWTHALLDPSQQALLARLGVCAGAVPLATVEAIADLGGDRAQTLDRMDGLLEFSFVRRHQSRDLGVRFLIPQALREFALERLAEAGDEPGVRRLHAEHVAHVARAARLWKWGATAEQRSDLLAVIDEIRPALAWAKEHDHELHVRICAALAFYWVCSGVPSEFVEELRRARESGAGTAADRAWTLTILAKCAQLIEIDEIAGQLADEALAQWRSVDDDRERALGLGPLSWVFRWASRHDEAIALAQEALADLRRSGERVLVLRGLSFLANALVDKQNVSGAEAVLAEADRLAQGDPVWELAAIHGDCALLRGEAARALQLYAESLSWTSTTGECHQMLMDFRCLVLCLARHGNGVAALEVHELYRLEEERTGRGVSDTPSWSSWLGEAVATAHGLVSSKEAQRATIRAGRVPATARARRAIDIASRAVRTTAAAARAT